MDETGTGYITASWDRDYDGADYTLTCTSESDSKNVETQDLKATVRNLSPETPYSVQLLSS